MTPARKVGVTFSSDVDYSIITGTVQDGASGDRK